VRTFVDVVGYANLALFSVVALVSFREWRSRQSRAGLWAAATFGALALVVDVGRAVPSNPGNDWELLAQKLLVAGLVLFPYFLYRFTTAFRVPTRRLERRLAVMTAVLLVWTFANPKLPATGEPRKGWYYAYLAGFLVHWTLLAIVVAVRLWRAGAGEPSVARNRMRTLTFSAGALTLALFLAVPSSDPHSGLALASGFLASVSALGFLVGLSPPTVLRLLWRRSEQQSIQAAIGGLMGATSIADVTSEVLPPMARMVGARGIELCGRDGAPIAGHGAPDGSAPSIVEGEFGSLRIWTSPYAPFFGDEELRLLLTLGSLIGLALERLRLFEQLARADELKTNFIALAAHELRTPVASAYGLAETMRTHALGPGQREAIDAAMYDAMRRMALLVEQLLDLSRLDAEAMPLEPERLRVSLRVEEIVRNTAGASEHVRVAIDPALEATVDPHALERIVSNLVANALLYGAPPVTVTAEQTDRHFRLAVEDRGEGVPPAFVPDLFERFSRSKRSARAGQGSGLGLAIARSFARAHGGDLLYTPVAPSGARFELVLVAPASPAASTGTEEAGQEPHQ
jgi:signal transduction histidine kinase